MGINTNETFSMRLDFAYGQATPNRDAPGRLGFVEPFQNNIFRESGLLSGIIATPVSVGTAIDSVGALAGSDDAATSPAKAYGTASQSVRLASVPEDSWLKVAGAALTNVGSSPSPAGGTRLKNARGLPLAIVVFWDPASYSATDAILTWKKAEAAWRAGEEGQVDHRCMLVPFDPQREDEIRTYALSAGARAWCRGQFPISDEEPAQAGEEQAAAPDPSAELTLEVSRVLPDGRLDAKM